MADLGVVLASIVGAVAEARRQADEQTAAMAEHYRREPLMEGMSIPRIRLPEVRIDLPILVSAQTPPDKGRPASVTVVTKALTVRLREVMARQNQGLPSGIINTFREVFKSGLTQEATAENAHELYVGAADKAVSVLQRKFSGQLDAGVVKVLRAELTRRARETAMATPATAGGVDVEVTTGKVRDSATAGVATTLHLLLREDAMEWAIFDRPDGTQGSRLLPE